MPAILSNAKKFLLTTDYPLDKVVYTLTGEVPIAAYGFIDRYVPHELPFTPLLQGNWTDQTTFDLSYEFGSGPLGGNPFTVNASIAADDTNVWLSISNNTSSQVTFRYRIYGLAPSGTDAEVPPTNVAVDSFMLDSGLNYTKLYLSGSVTQAPTTPNVLGTVVHGLGYLPQAIVWLQRNGWTFPYTYALVGPTSPFDEVLAEVTTSALTFSFTGTLSEITMHYRVYLDD